MDNNLIRGVVYLDRDNILWISYKREKIFWDANAFRPDPRNVLKKEKEYPSRILYEEENLYNGSSILVPRKINISKPKSLFVNVR